MIRFGMRLTDELHQIYKDKSDKTGVPMSMLVLMDLEKLNEQREVQKSIAIVDDLMKKAILMQEKGIKDDSEEVKELVEEVNRLAKKEK